MYSFSVQITIEIPDALAAEYLPSGRDATGVVLELFGLQAYRDGRISERALKHMLGFESIFDVQAFLMARLGDEGQDTIESVENDLANLRSAISAQSERVARAT